MLTAWLKLSQLLGLACYLPLSLLCWLSCLSTLLLLKLLHQLDGFAAEGCMQPLGLCVDLGSFLHCWLLCPGLSWLGYLHQLLSQGWLGC